MSRLMLMGADVGKRVAVGEFGLNRAVAGALAVAQPSPLLHRDNHTAASSQRPIRRPPGSRASRMA